LCDLENPRLEAEALLCSLLQKNRTWLRTHSKDRLSFLDTLKFKYWVWRRSEGVPLAYIRGYQDWHDQKFVVNRSVLIPRDETETLLRHIIENREQKVVSSVLDIGTGRGCLAIELKRFFGEAEVTALDISKKALSVARANAALHHQDVAFKHSDLLSVIEEGAQFDLIVANLPYVPTDIVITKEVKQEPSTAIFSGIGGLDHYRRLASELKSKNVRFNNLWLEFLPSQKDQIAVIFSDYAVEFRADVAGNLFFAEVSPQP